MDSIRVRLQLQQLNGLCLHLVVALQNAPSFLSSSGEEEEGLSVQRKRAADKDEDSRLYVDQSTD